MATPASDIEERQAHARYASTYSKETYRTRLAELYRAWWDSNNDFFGGHLLEPHLALGRTAPRCLGHCMPCTDYGAKVQISLNAGLTFGTNSDLVIHAWPPAEGTGRFIQDLLLRFTVQHYVLEVLEEEERGYRGFGPQFVIQANRIGATLGLGPVVVRRRASDDQQPIASGWPHCVRPASYYGDDVTEAALELARGSLERARRSPTTPSQGLLELLLFLLNNGRTDEAQRLLVRHLEWVRLSLESRWLPRRQVEAGLQDVDGSKLGEVTFSTDWLLWNGGTVRKIAQSINQFKSFGDLPILADALEEAGCNDGRILRHLRERMEHSQRCWVLRLLLALEV